MCVWGGGGTAVNHPSSIIDTRMKTRITLTMTSDDPRRGLLHCVRRDPATMDMERVLFGVHDPAPSRAHSSTNPLSRERDAPARTHTHSLSRSPSFQQHVCVLFCSCAPRVQLLATLGVYERHGDALDRFG